MIIGMMTTTLNQTKTEIKVGTRVKFHRNTLHGPKVTTGSVSMIQPDGRFEVRWVMGGFYILTAAEILETF